MGPAFEMTVSAAQARDTPITYPTLEALLLTTERRMVDQNPPVVENGPVNAINASRGRGGGRTRGSGKGGVSNRGAAFTQRGFNPCNNINQSNTSSNTEKFVPNGDKIVCQI